MLSFFSLITTIHPRVSTEPLPNIAKSPLPVDGRRSKTLLLKLPNMRFQKCADSCGHDLNDITVDTFCSSSSRQSFIPQSTLFNDWSGTDVVVTTATSTLVIKESTPPVQYKLT